ncbi:MAG: hypothetical protein WBD31_12195 [Rubripirellula sp.]
MTQLRFFALVACVAATTVCHNASAAITTGYGVSAGVTTYSNCPSFCTGLSDGESSGGEFATFANVSNSTYGTAAARAFYDGSSTYLPVLKAFASSVAGRGAGASAFGAQGFTYSGTEAKLLTIDFQLDASVTGNAAGDLSPDNRASASIGVLRGGNGLFGSNIAFSSGFGTYYYENFGERLGERSVGVTVPNGSSAGSLSFTVNPGDEFFVAASLNATTRAGTVDAFNTFTSSFTDATGITAIAVPEPTSAGVLAMASVVILLTKRRKRIA